MSDTTPNDTITCESTFVGNVFGYKTSVQWVFNTIDWLDGCIKSDNERPLHKLSKFDYRALMRDITQALDDINGWGEVCDLEAIEIGLRNSLDGFDFDNQSTLVITAEGYETAFDDINKKLADGAYIIK